MSVTNRKLILTGGRKGKTCVLGRQFKFQDGIMHLSGSTPDVEAMTLYLGRCYEAYPEGSVELEAANGKRDLQETPKEHKEHAVSGDVQPPGPGAAEEKTTDGAGHDDAEAGEAGVRAEGDGHQAIREALSQLDTVNDKHWTAEGLPAVVAVAEILGMVVTREEITAVAPDFNRKG